MNRVANEVSDEFRMNSKIPTLTIEDQGMRKYLSVFLCWVTTSLVAQEYARDGMVVSASEIASEVGVAILKDGGNAIDAAVATAFALAVTWPSAGNIGGGGFIVYRQHTGEVTTFDFREKAPAAATSTMYLDENGDLVKDLNHLSILAVGVPGTVAGLYDAHRLYGKLPWARLVRPAVRLARKGFSYTYGIYHDAIYHEKRWKEIPSTAAVMFRDGTTMYQPGETWRQPDLARTLARIKRRGKEGFYSGKTAEKLVSFIQSQGGIMTRLDLAEYEARERMPVTGTYRGYDIYSMAPPSSGGVTLIQMLNILEGFNLTAYGYHSAAYVHVVSEAMRRGYANRALHLGDPDFNPDMPIEKLISKEYAATLRNTIVPDTVSVSDPAAFSQPYESPNTTHLSVVDKEGNAVSLTYTLEYAYGSQIVADGLGFFLNNEMGDFNPIPGVTNDEGLIGTPPNLIAPGKRMLSSMTPTILAKDGKLFMLIGSPGGRSIIGTVLQVILNVVDHDMDIAMAIESGRFYHQWLPDVIAYEKYSLTDDTLDLLSQIGHRLRQIRMQGAAMGIVFDADRGVLSGHADSRSPDGGVAGY
ncbi:MAG TPA: gamma-glutamyltransferase [Cyclobacteriaceae bacterium]|nr:gamma-glutamyltransferase [Cyclobacteriaceae bacterium]